MKILFISGSNRTDGNTARALKVFEEKLKALSRAHSVALEIETVCPGQSGIEFCRGCRVCFDQGEERCPLKDGLLGIRDRMLGADALVVASPVYVEDVSGVMKNWIDRMAFVSHRPALFGKCAWLITTSAMGSSDHAPRTMATALISWGARIAGKTKLRLGALSGIREIETRYGAKIGQAAARFLRAALSRSADKPSMFSLVAFRVQKRYWLKNERFRDSYDFRYWKDMGWLEPGAVYYAPQRAGAVRTALAGLVGEAVAAFLG